MEEKVKNKKSKKIILVVILLICIICVISIIVSYKIKPTKTNVVANNEELYLKSQGETFKDLNKNNELDKYEDWRLENRERAEDLVSKMTLEEKAGMLVINTQTMGILQNDKTLTSMDGVLDEETTSNDVYINMNKKGNTETIRDLNIRHVILRQEAEASEIAKWSNALNIVAEESRLGIPVIVTSNSRNESSSQEVCYKKENTTKFPSTLGIAAAAMGEKDEILNVIKTFAEIVRKEFTSLGIRKAYMYSADLSTDPRWVRISETLGEDAEFVTKAIEKIVTTIQGESLNNTGVALTIKHFPGSGATKNGFDAHYELGRYSPYTTENSLANYHLKTFQAAINAGVSSIMPYYSQPDPNSAKQVYNGKEIDMKTEAYTYNSEFLTELLRDNMGFEGYINTDSGVIDFICWGEENKTNAEKVAKAINSGVDLISDTNHIDWIIEAVNNGLISEERLNESVKRVLLEMFELGMFENPYVDVEQASQVVASQESLDKAYEIHQKSVVLMKNKEEVLPIKSEENKKVKIYTREYGTGGRIIAEALERKSYDIEIVNSIEEADYYFTFINLKVGTLTELTNLSLKNAMSSSYDMWVNDCNKIHEQGGKVVTIINFKNPYILEGVEEYSDAILGGFNTYSTAILDVVVGSCDAQGVLPFTLPASEDVIKIDENGNCISPNDVPGYDKSKYMPEGMKYEYVDEQNNSYLAGFGLSYK